MFKGIPYPAFLAAAFLAPIVGCGGSGSVTGSTPEEFAPKPPQRNFVVILTDDLDELTRKQMRGPLIDQLANQGLTFSRMMVPQSLCTPTRASILTGQHIHNHGVWDNIVPYGFPAFQKLEGQSLGPWMKAAGYTNAYFGKYMNAFPANAGDGYQPPGWDEWCGHLTSFEDGRYYNYWMSCNGSVARFGTRPDEYSTDVITKRATDFIKSSAGDKKPLLIVLAPQAPHGPATPAGRHTGEFKDAGAPDHLPSFNLGDVQNKPSWVRQKPLLTPDDVRRLHRLQQDRLRSLRAVEEQIEQVLEALRATGRLENTYIFFTSDNGMLMGQHRGFAVKGNAYEEAVNVPLIIRGPGVPVGVVNAFVSAIDIAPTILELAGAPIPASVDGRSLVPFLKGQLPPWRSDSITVNYGGRPGSVSYTLRIVIKDGLYAGEWMLNLQDTGGDDHPFSGDYELYCMSGAPALGIAADPSQIRNLFRRFSLEHPEFIKGLRTRLTALSTCSGASCRQ